MQNMFLNRAFVKQGPPIHLVWFVTGVCNLKCQHCFFHENLNAGKNELSLDEFDRITSTMSPALAICLTGGETFLRPDLPEIVDMLCKRELTRNVTMYSNGFATDTIQSAVEHMTTNWADVSFSVGISIDGFEQTHDRLRGVPGAFKRAMTTLASLSAMARRIPNFSFGIQTTIHAETVHELPELRSELKARFGVKPGFTMIRGDAKDPNLKTVTPQTYRNIIDLNQADINEAQEASMFKALVRARESLGHAMAYETYVSKRRDYDCYGGTLMGVISETGDVYPCEMIDNGLMGNLRDHNYDLNALWRDAANAPLRKRIKDRTCHCTYECQYTCNTLYNVKYWPQYLKAVLKHAF
ncbi:radical SAM protein [Pseudodesulfovibrio sp.]|nr:radical SAM protein [Pseudodesulfovibrio sp.]